MRNRRTPSGWPAPPTTSEGSTPRPSVLVRDVDEDRWIEEPEPERPRLHPVWPAFAMSIGINFGLIAALAVAAWFWSGP